MKTIYKILSVILICATLSSCTPNTPTRSRNEEEIAVYSAIFNEQKDQSDSYLSYTRTLLINRETRFYDFEKNDLLTSFVFVENSTYEDYIAANQQSSTLDYVFTEIGNYEYFDFPEPGEDYWEEQQAMMDKYPLFTSVTTFSRVGFNEEMDEALVFVSYYCGALCGTGGVFKLVRIGETWKVRKKSWWIVS
jgi:hypothetical protein